MRKIITTLFIIFFNITFSYAQTYFLPDTNFVNAIKTKYPTLLRNDSLLTENAKKITGWVDFQSKNLNNIDGIQFFTNIGQLNLAKNNLTSIPNLDSLDIMTQVYVSENQLTELPKFAISVRNIFAFSNKLTTVDNITNLSALTFLHVSKNQLESLPNLSNFPNLVQLHCNQNKIKSIEGLGTLQKITHLYLWENQLTDIESLNNNTSVNILYINNNNIQNLPKLDNKPNLVELSIGLNYFTFEDIYPVFDLDSVKSFSYSPMKNLVLNQKVTAYDNSDVIIKSNIDTTLKDLTYSLFRNDTLFITENSNGIFQVSSKNYAKNDTFTIKIKSQKAPKIVVNHERWVLRTADCKETNPPYLSVLENDCSTGASIKLILTDQLIGFDTLIYSLKSKSSDQIFQFDSTFTLYNVNQGVYLMETKTESLCQTSNQIIIPNAPNCDQVFSPNNDGLKDQFYFDKKGEVKIYNLKGECIKTIDTPAAWDGKDKNGNLVPFGYYSVILNDSEISHITILK